LTVAMGMFTAVTALGRLSSGHYAVFVWSPFNKTRFIHLASWQSIVRRPS